MADNTESQDFSSLGCCSSVLVQHPIKIGGQFEYNVVLTIRTDGEAASQELSDKIRGCASVLVPAVLHAWETENAGTEWVRWTEQRGPLEVAITTGLRVLSDQGDEEAEINDRQHVHNNGELGTECFPLGHSAGTYKRRTTTITSGELHTAHSLAICDRLLRIYQGSVQGEGLAGLETELAECKIDDKWSLLDTILGAYKAACDTFASKAGTKLIADKPSTEEM